MGWRDEFRVWNTTFPLLCLQSIIIPHGIDSGMWLPDVAVVTADSFYDLPKSDLYPLRLHSNGKVDFAPGGFIRFQCKMNIDLFPFDSMSCLARVESWFYTADRQIFNREESKILVYNFTEHEQWKLDEYKIEFEDVFYETSGLTYGAINYMISLSRKSGYYMMNIIIPSSMMSTLELVTFVLPPNQTIRIEVSFICLLAYTMFQSVISADLPKSADQTPLLSVYITLMIVYIAIAISLQCIVMTMTNKAAMGSQIPNWVMRYVKSSWVESPIKKKAKNDKEKPDDPEKPAMSDEEPGIKDKHGHDEPPPKLNLAQKSNSRIWKRLYLQVDRLAALLYFVLIMVTSLVLLVAVPSLENSSK